MTSENFIFWKHSKMFGAAWKLAKCLRFMSWSTLFSNLIFHDFNTIEIIFTNRSRWNTENINDNPY